MAQFGDVQFGLFSTRRASNGALTVASLGLAAGTCEKNTESKSQEIASASTFSTPGMCPMSTGHG